jgi:hypothetical protein
MNHPNRSRLQKKKAEKEFKEIRNTNEEDFRKKRVESREK